MYHNNNIIVDNNVMFVYIDNNRQDLRIPRWNKTLTNIHKLYSKMQLNFMVANNIVISPISFWQLLWHLLNIAQAYLLCHKLQLRYGEVRGGTHVVPPLLSQSYM